MNKHHRDVLFVPTNTVGNGRHTPIYKITCFAFLRSPFALRSSSGPLSSAEQNGSESLISRWHFEQHFSLNPHADSVHLERPSARSTAHSSTDTHNANNCHLLTAALISPVRLAAYPRSVSCPSEDMSTGQNAASARSDFPISVVAYSIPESTRSKFSTCT